MSQIVFSIPCPATILPTRADLTNIFHQLVNIPSQLQVLAEKILREAENAAAEEVMRQVRPILQAVETIRAIIKNIEKALGNFPISLSKPVFPSISTLAIEWERRITALTQEFHTYVYAKILELLTSIISIPLEVPIPPFGIMVDIIKLWGDPAYRAKLKAQIAANVAQFWEMLPDPYKAFGMAVTSIEMKAHAVFVYLMSVVKNGAIKLIIDLINKIIKLFKPIWDLLGLPPLPDLLVLDAAGLIDALIGSLKKEALALIEQAKRGIAGAAEKVVAIYKLMIEKLKNFEVLGFKLIDIIGGEIIDFVKSPEVELNRIIEAIRDFCEDYPAYLIKLAIQKIMGFLKKIGLGAILDWLLFDFCKFLKLVGMPTSISVDIGNNSLPKVP